MNAYQQVSEAFASELRKLHERMDWSDYQNSDVVLRVRYQNGRATAEIEITTGKDYPRVVVKGADFGTVMDETYRRLNYEDREAGKIETSLTALPPPQEIGI